jgi:hypothetical protein
MFSDNVIDYSDFCKNLFDQLNITKNEHKNQLFVMGLVKKLYQFAVLKGHPQLTIKKETGQSRMSNIFIA